MPKTLHSIQYLRAVAALLVVVFHAATKSGVSFDVGQAGVDLFFVLSGFLMWSITSEKVVNPYQFALDRIVRVVPTYWIATSVVFVGAMLSLFPNLTLAPYHTVASYLFLPAISPSNGEAWPLLVPGWTLNYEMSFYAIFTVALLLPRSFRLAAISVALCTLFLAGLIIQPESVALRFYTDSIILEFSVGIILAATIQRLPVARFRTAAFIFAVALLWAYTFHEAGSRVIRWGVPATLCLCTCIILEQNGLVPRLRIPSLLGDASYSIYLWHTLAISVAAKLLVPMMLPSGMQTVALCFAGVLVGVIAYYAIERPLLARLRSGSSRVTLRPAT